MGIVTLDHNVLRLTNKTNDTSITLNEEQRKRWHRHLLKTGGRVVQKGKNENFPYSNAS